MNHSASAREYLHSMEDAQTFLRYAELALAAAKRAAPDHPSKTDVSKVHANCGVTFGQLKEARNRTLSRYTPRGQRKSRHQPPITAKRSKKS